MAKRSYYNKSASPKQANKFAHLLSEDEELVLITGYSSFYTRNRFAYYIVLPGMVFWAIGFGLAYYLQINVGIGLLVGLIFSMVYALIQTLWMYHSHRYLLTTRRVMLKSGYFTVKLTSALFDKITHIQVDQSFFDRVIMHHGDVIIHTAGMNKGELRLDYIEAPLEFKNLLEKLISREREQFGNPKGPIFTIEGELVK